MVLKQLKDLKSKIFSEKKEPEPVEIGLKDDSLPKTLSLDLVVLENFSDSERALENMREGDRILMLKIRSLRENNMADLKKAVNRLKTHCAATGANLAAIDDNWIVVVPPTVGLERL
jgi:SepF-like predicted cell division protein (DUF552 family)